MSNYRSLDSRSPSAKNPLSIRDPLQTLDIRQSGVRFKKTGNKLQSHQDLEVRLCYASNVSSPKSQISNEKVNCSILQAFEKEDSNSNGQTIVKLAKDFKNNQNHNFNCQITIQNCSKSSSNLLFQDYLSNFENPSSFCMLNENINQDSINLMFLMHQLAQMRIIFSYSCKNQLSLPTMKPFCLIYEEQRNPQLHKVYLKRYKRLVSPIRIRIRENHSQSFTSALPNNQILTTYATPLPNYGHFCQVSQFFQIVTIEYKIHFNVSTQATSGKFIQHTNKLLRGSIQTSRPFEHKLIRSMIFNNLFKTSNLLLDDQLFLIINRIDSKPTFNYCDWLLGRQFHQRINQKGNKVYELEGSLLLNNPRLFLLYEKSQISFENKYCSYFCTYSLNSKQFKHLFKSFAATLTVFKDICQTKIGVIERIANFFKFSASELSKVSIRIFSFIFERLKTKSQITTLGSQLFYFKQ